MSRAEVALHPLVLVNISDHYSRVKLSQSSGSQVRAIGAFVGIQDGANVSVLDSMEVMIDPASMTVNLELLRRKLALTVAVFPRFEFLGWYISGPLLSDQEMITVQKQMQELNESPLVLIMDATAIASGKPSASGSDAQKKKKVLPITVYETVMQRINDQPAQTFVEVPVKVETTESERITVDHAATQKSSMGRTASTLDPHMAALKNAVQMLKGRITIVRAYVEMVKQGKLPADHDLMREAETICNQLPAFDPALLRKDFQTELSDALLVSLLSSITKETAAMSSVLEKFFVTFPTPGTAEEKNEVRSIAQAAGKKGAGPGKGKMS